MIHTPEVVFEKYINRIMFEVRRMLNTSIFSIYYGTVTDTSKYPISVECYLPSLDSTHTCYLVYPFASKNCMLQTPIEKGSRVVVLCPAFGITGMLAFGQIPNTFDKMNNKKDNICLKNGTAEIVLEPNKITLKNGDASIVISKNNITLNGSSVTCAGDDLKVDKRG